MSTEETLQGIEAKLDLMWDKIQELKQTDTFAAQIMYEKYRRIVNELPPPLPPVICRPSSESVTNTEGAAGGLPCQEP